MSRGPASRAMIAICTLVSAGAAQDLRVRIKPLIGDDVIGEISSIDEDGTVSLEGGRTLHLADLVEISSAESTPIRTAPTELRGLVSLRSGNRLAVEFTGGRGGRVALRSAHGSLELRLEHLGAIRFAGENVADDSGFADALDEPPQATDYVFAWTPDGGALKRYSMRVVGCDGDTLRVTVSGKSRTLPVSRVYGIVFGEDNGFAPDPLPKPLASVTCEAGEPLVGRLVRWRDGVCDLRLAEECVLHIDTGRVARVRIDSGRLAYLSELVPTEVQHVPALNREKPWLRNRTPVGEGLHLGEVQFANGLCLPPRTTLTFEIDGTFDVFTAMVGIDSRSSRDAHAVLRVLLDGAVVFDTGGINAGSAQRVSIPLGDAKRLSLEADFGENLDLGDHCVFADARLLKG